MGRDHKRSRSRSPRKRSRSRDRRREKRSGSRDPKRSKSRERKRSRDHRNDRPTSSREHKQEPKRENVKTEEEFDRRQDNARQRRQHDQRRDNVKQEPSSPPRPSNVFAEELRNFAEQDWGKKDDNKKGNEEQKPKEKPNLGLSGALTADTNTYKGVVIKYSEPPEAKIPKKRWRFYPFKGDELLKIIYLHRQSAYLVGRLTHVCEIPVEHPSCSKQHAAVQFRAVKITKPSGRDVISVRPYIIDLESSNGTYLNNTRLEPKRYYEMREKDVVKFGYSTREYVLLHEKTDTSEVHEDTSEDEVSSEEE